MDSLSVVCTSCDPAWAAIKLVAVAAGLMLAWFVFRKRQPSMKWGALQVLFHSLQVYRVLLEFMSKRTGPIVSGETVWMQAGSLLDIQCLSGGRVDPFTLNFFLHGVTMPLACSVTLILTSLQLRASKQRKRRQQMDQSGQQRVPACRSAAAAPIKQQPQPQPPQQPQPQPQQDHQQPSTLSNASFRNSSSVSIVAHGPLKELENRTPSCVKGDSVKTFTPACSPTYRHACVSPTAAATATVIGDDGGSGSGSGSGGGEKDRKDDDDDDDDYGELTHIDSEDWDLNVDFMKIAPDTVLVRAAKIHRFAFTAVMFVLVDTVSVYVGTFNCFQDVSTNQQLLLASPSIVCYQDPLHKAVAAIAATGLLLMAACLCAMVMKLRRIQQSGEMNKPANYRLFGVLTWLFVRLFLLFSYQVSRLLIPSSIPLPFLPHFHHYSALPSSRLVPPSCFAKQSCLRWLPCLHRLTCRRRLCVSSTACTLWRCCAGGRTWGS